MSYRDDRGGDRDRGRDNRGGGGYGGGGGGGFRRPPRDVDRMTSLRVGNLPFRSVCSSFCTQILLTRAETFSDQCNREPTKEFREEIR